jgi:hypothetical protein
MLWEALETFLSAKKAFRLHDWMIEEKEKPVFLWRGENTPKSDRLQGIDAMGPR